MSGSSRDRVVERGRDRRRSSAVRQTYVTRSCEETIALGETLARLLQPPKVIILRGDLGAGKTTLVKGIAAALDAAEPEEVTSPTFTLIHEYAGRAIEPARDADRESALEPAGPRENLGDVVLLYHLDLYRIESQRQLDTLGIEDLMTPQSLVLIEWGEKFPSVVARSDGEIAIDMLAGDGRRVTLVLRP